MSNGLPEQFISTDLNSFEIMEERLKWLVINNGKHITPEDLTLIKAFSDGVYPLEYVCSRLGLIISAMTDPTHKTSL